MNVPPATSVIGENMLRITDRDSVRELQLDHPPVNALRAGLLTALRTALEEASAQSVRALLISGRPGYFSAGLDVPYYLGQSQDAVNAVFHELFALMRALGTAPMPIAAAVTGHSPAGGALIAMLCDYRVMADGPFKIGLSEVQVGLPVPPVIYNAMSRLVGPRVAERLCVEGQLLSPEEAAQVGLVDEVAQGERVREAALAWCRRMLALPPRAMRLTRAAARTELGRIFAEFGWEELDELASGWAGEETQSALRAMVERLGRK